MEQWLKSNASGFYNNITDEVGTFWVVVEPTPSSTADDICFDATIRNMMLQAMGGLSPKEVVAIYKNEGDAKKHAEQLLKARRDEADKLD
jgi:hypothetical protein